MTFSVLIVDDEDGVRRTFHDWLKGLADVRVFAAADAEAALLVANEHPVDLAVLDWNLGSGSDGLRLLEDLVDFQPDIVAILVTGFANQATPLDALRMGVRDYLDKNHDLTRDVFLSAVRKQLDRLAPLKRQRELNHTLAEFRDAVERILPLVRGSAALNEPVPVPAAVHALFRFLLQATGAADGAVIVRHAPPDGPDTLAAYGPEGTARDIAGVPFARSLAAGVVGLQDPCVMTDFDPDSLGGIELMPFERNRRAILAAPLPVGSAAQVVLELFDKPAFTDADRKLVAATSEVAAELLRQALAERSTSRLLFDAVEGALKASDTVRDTLAGSAPPSAVLEPLRRGLPADFADADTGLKLLEAVRALAVRHGPPAVDHCLRVVESVQVLLDQAQG